LKKGELKMKSTLAFVVCAAFAIPSAVFGTTRANDLAPASARELAAAYGGAGCMINSVAAPCCVDCKTRPIDCASTPCEPFGDGTWSKGFGSGRTVDPYCASGLAAGLIGCIDNSAPQMCLTVALFSANDCDNSSFITILFSTTANGGCVGGGTCPTTP
jgi:hypothetical protein